MNCSQCRERLTAYLEGLLTPQDELDVVRHVESCPACRVETEAHRRLCARLVANGRAFAGTSLDDVVMRRISERQTSRMETSKMRKRYGKVGLGLAAAAAVAAVFIVPWGNSGHGRAKAAEVLAAAVEAASGLRSVHIRLSTRTEPYDNFEYIGLDCELVPHEMWKEFSEPTRWRVEKPGRAVAVDGERSRLLIKAPPDEGRSPLASEGSVNTGYVGWLLELLDVEAVLERQLRLAEQMRWHLDLSHEAGPDGTGQLVVTVEAKAQGDFTNDWCKNKSIAASDHRRVYRFGAETKRLEDLEVWVHADGGDVLVLDTEEIAYDPEIPADLFVLEVPPDAVWFEEPEVLPDNEHYARLSPKEAAEAFFEACAAQDWEEALKFLPVSRLDERGQERLGGLEIISIGEPFESGRYPGWFVPYEVKLKSGDVKRHNLALRNDNAAGRFVVDGGL